MSRKKYTKKSSFTLLELLIVISLIAIIYSQIKPKNIDNNLKLAADRLILYLNYTKYLAMNENKFDNTDKLWFRKRWTFKLKNCSSSVGGIYYVIYSDENKKGHVNKSETIKDPLTKKWVYSNYDCVAGEDESKYVLLTKEFGIIDAQLSCNETSTIGQISFGFDGRVYTKLSNFDDGTYNYQLKEDCFLKLIDKNENSKTIKISAFTGFTSEIKE